MVNQAADVHTCTLKQKGPHLLVCERFQCGNKYFKCPKYYCVPWNKVCDGHWECPAGADEAHCNRTNCPGQYKCHIVYLGMLWRLTHVKKGFIRAIEWIVQGSVMNLAKKHLIL